MNIILILTPYLVAAASIACNLAFFFLLKIEIRKQNERNNKSRRDIQAMTESLASEIREKLQQGAQQPLVPFYPPRRSLNLTRRHQILRLQLRGERPERIAAALGIPVNEVELLLKVQQASSAAAG
jgi:hypothetical protein